MILSLSFWAVAVSLFSFRVTQGRRGISSATRSEKWRVASPSNRNFGLNFTHHESLVADHRFSGSRMDYRSSWQPERAKVCHILDAFRLAFIR
jgi:hypothetical protein